MSTLQLDHVSRWYRNVVAVNDVSMTIGPGVTGLQRSIRRTMAFDWQASASVRNWFAKAA